MPYVLNEIEDLKEQRKKKGDEVRALYELAKSETRALTGDEDAKVKTILADAEALQKRFEQMEKADGLIQATAHTTASTRAAAAIEPDTADDDETFEDRLKRDPRNRKAYRRAFRGFCEAENSLEAQRALGTVREIERRDLQTDNYSQAGVLVPPLQWVNELIKNIDDATFVGGFARTFKQVTAKSLGAPKRVTKLSTWRRGAEIGAPVADTALAYGARQLFPSYASGLAKVSRDWLRNSSIPGEQIVREEMARDSGEMLEQEYFTGSGAAGQALGVFTASALGISTSRDVSTGNTTTAPTLAGLRAAKYSIKEPYWKNLRWVGSRTFHQHLYSMDDGNGRPLFTESLKAGEVDRVLSFPVHISEFAPSTFTTGLYVAILGDWFSGYWIAWSLEAELQRLDELYAETNQVGFIGRLKQDAAPVLEECWARVKLA